jgi:hypothetical protein
MQNCVGKFILEIILVQELADSVCNYWRFQKLVDVRTLCWVSLEH